MPFYSSGAVRLYYKLDGHPDRSLLVLGNSLGTDMSMWRRQIDALTSHFRVMRFDMRGHGASDVPAADIRMAEFGADVLALADRAGAKTFAYVGLSLGAMIGQWLALNAPQRLSKLVLSNAAAHLPSRESWSSRMALARSEGMSALVDMVMPRFFSDAYRAMDEPFYHSIRTSFASMSAQGYAASCAAVRDADFRDALDRITTPTLVISGALDTATPADTFGRELVQRIPGASSVVLRAGHIANIEQPEAFNQAVLEFLTR